MGNKLASQTPQLDYYLHDLPGIVFEQSLGNSRFLKTIRCVHDEGPVVVKVYVKRPPQNDLKEYADKLRRIRDAFSDVAPCNVFPISKFVETEKAGYLIRQYFVNNLHDRIGTRPFLTLVEKQWITFQLLHALRSCHSHGICHGDIKCENVMVTSWNWVYLTDFASVYKPTYIPEDSPSDFSFYFDTSGRRACYLAPERLSSTSKASSRANTDAFGPVTPQMDIFSLGCVIAELFLDGSPRTIFSLAQLLSYRKGEYDPAYAIDRIDCDEIKLLIKTMIDMDPEKRMTADYFLDNWSDLGLPAYFPQLHNYIASLMEMSPDEKIFNIQANFTRLLERMHQATAEQHCKDPELSIKSHSSAISGDDIVVPDANAASPEEKHQHQHELEKQIPLGLPPAYAEEYLSFAEGLGEQTDDLALLVKVADFVLDLQKEADGSAANAEGGRAPNTSDAVSATVSDTTEALAEEKSLHVTPQPGGEGMTVVLAMICSCIHSVVSPTIRVTALELMMRVAEHLDDRCRLDRIVPYIVSLLHDEAALIRSFAISSLTRVLRMVGSFPASDAHVFTEYIMPSLAHIPADPAILVRNTFAQNLGLLAEVARRFLEAAQLYKQSDSLSIGERDKKSFRQSGYDAELDVLQHVFYQVIATMFAKDCPSSAKLALLTDIDRLAYFFGRDKSVDQLLPLIVTFLNDQNWELRCAFFEHIVGICSFVGTTSLEHFIYPCILQAMTDREEFVVAKAASLLSRLCEMGLFRKHMMFEVVRKTLPMLLHPNTWVRYAVVSVVTQVAAQLDDCDVFCFIIPHVRPYLVGDIDDVTVDLLLEGLKAPIARQTFERAVSVCSESLQKFYRSGGARARPQSQMTGKKADVDPVAPYDPEDPFLEVVLEDFANSGLSGEKETLLLMLPYIRESTRGSHRMENDGRSRISSGTADPEVEEFSSLSQSIPVHSVAVLPAGDERKIEELMASDGEWRYLALAADPMKSQPMDDEGNTSITLDFQSCVKKVKQLAVPPALPDMGGLYRVGDGAAAPVSGESLIDWKPKGLLVASLQEHKKAITEIEVTKDNLFFVTASRDDTVKIWDSARLETNVTNRSRLTFRVPNNCGSPTSLSVLENTHSVAVGLESGQVKIFRVEYVVHPKYIQYTSCASVCDDYDTSSAVVALEHYNKDVQSLLVAATSKGTIHGLDLRTRANAFKMDNAAKSGLITSMVVEPNRNWLVAGTSLGCYTCWDIRFNIPLSTWWHPLPEKRIHRMVHYSHKLGGNSYVFAAVGNGDVFLWDVESGSCLSVWQVLSDKEDVTTLRAQSSSAASGAGSALDFSTSIARPQAGKDLSQRGLVMPKNSHGFFTAGADRCLRYWDMTNIHNSYTLNRPEPQVRYRQLRVDGADLYRERPLPTARKPVDEERNGKVLPAVDHLDCITDLAVLEQPIRLLISGSRDGVVKVWK